MISGYANAVNGGPAGNAVELEHGGIVTNAGTLLNGGVYVGGAAGTIINSGVILGSSAYGGVYMRFGGPGHQFGRRRDFSEWRHGLVSRCAALRRFHPRRGRYRNQRGDNQGRGGSTGNAVELATGFQNRLIVDPGAVFVGTVTGGTAADATLELASAASTGTLSGFGTQFTNFGTVTLDPSASWLIKASTAVTAAVINGFAANDTLDLAGFVAVSRTFTSNALVLTNASSASVTLHIQGSLATSNFTIGGDGAGGTDIAFSAGTVAALAYGQTIDETGIVATSETVTAGTMTLFNGASPVGTVAVGTSLSSGDFLLRSDGAGGTDVIVNTAFGTYTSGVTLLANPTTIAGTAKITGSLAGAVGVGGPPGTAWTLTNQGLVSETGAGSDGVSLASAGTVINAATITGGVAAGSGIVLAAGGSVTNQSGGTISGYRRYHGPGQPGHGGERRRHRRQLHHQQRRRRLPPGRRLGHQPVERQDHRRQQRHQDRRRPRDRGQPGNHPIERYPRPERRGRYLPGRRWRRHQRRVRRHRQLGVYPGLSLRASRSERRPPAR